MARQDTKHLILQALADGQFHSGEALGAQLGISRAAVSKHIKSFEAMGVDIFCVNGKGYKLAEPLSLLDEKAICQSLGDNYPGLALMHVTDSTNEVLLRHIRAKTPLDKGHTIIAECQTAGRGRRGRSWVSPFGAHIYLSMYWRLDSIGQAMGLSIAVGIALREALQPFMNNAVSVKWPNDLLVGDRKLAGILVEMEGQADGPCDLVIGVGINVNMPQEAGLQIDQPWTDVGQHHEGLLDRNQLVTRIVSAMYGRLNEFEVHGLKQMLPHWNSHDRFYDKSVKLLMGSRTIEGIGRGIDAFGGIKVADRHSKMEKVYYGGEISLRADRQD